MLKVFKPIQFVEAASHFAEVAGDQGGVAPVTLRAMLRAARHTPHMSDTQTCIEALSVLVAAANLQAALQNADKGYQHRPRIEFSTGRTVLWWMNLDEGMVDMVWWHNPRQWLVRGPYYSEAPEPDAQDARVAD